MFFNGIRYADAPNFKINANSVGGGVMKEERG
jgi:hypothetical protein